MVSSMSQNLEEQECQNCGLIGMLRRGQVADAITFTYDKTKGHPVKEPNTPVEGIVCAACGHLTLLEPETV